MLDVAHGYSASQNIRRYDHTCDDNSIDAVIDSCRSHNYVNEEGGQQ